MVNGNKSSSLATDGGDQQQHGAWKQVSRRKNPFSGQLIGDSDTGKSNQSQNITPSNLKSSILQRMSLSFYLTNFPHNVTYKDMWNLLRSNLITMWFAKFKIFADIVRFNRIFNARKPSSQQQSKMESTTNLDLNSNYRKSYADVAAGKNCNSSGPVNNNTASSTAPVIRRIVKVTCDSEADGISSTFSVLLKVIEPAFIPSVRQWFHSEGILDVCIYYVGGRWLHVSFASIEDKNRFLANDSLKVKFGAIKSPDDSFIPDERMVWVEVFGVPKGAWHTKTFVDILEPWGKGIFFYCEWISAVSVGKVCLLSQSQSFIFEELTISLDDKPYNVWIKEFASWEPNLLSPNYAGNASDKDVTNSDDTNGYSEAGDDSSNKRDSMDFNLCKDASSNEEVNDLAVDVGSCANSPLDESDGVEFQENQERVTNDNSVDLVRFFESDHGKVQSAGDCGTDANVDRADVNNSSVPEVAEELPSLDRSSAKEAPPAYHNNGLDDHDIFLLNRLLHQDKCRGRSVNPDVNEKCNAPSESPLKHDLSFSENCWSYKDPSGKVHGPFSLAQLQKWKDCFPSNFQIWRQYGSVKETILLLNALKRRSKDVG